MTYFVLNGLNREVKWCSSLFKLSFHKSIVLLLKMKDCFKMQPEQLSLWPIYCFIAWVKYFPLLLLYYTVYMIVLEHDTLVSLLYTLL